MRQVEMHSLGLVDRLGQGLTRQYEVTNATGADVQLCLVAAPSQGEPWAILCDGRPVMTGPEVTAHGAVNIMRRQRPEHAWLAVPSSLYWGQQPEPEWADVPDESEPPTAPYQLSQAVLRVAAEYGYQAVPSLDKREGEN